MGPLPAGITQGVLAALPHIAAESRCLQLLPALPVLPGHTSTWAHASAHRQWARPGSAWRNLHGQHRLSWVSQAPLAGDGPPGLCLALLSRQNDVIPTLALAPTAWPGLLAWRQREDGLGTQGWPDGITGWEERSSFQISSLFSFPCAATYQHPMGSSCA